ncbi:MAG: thiamine pyrophosphate-binding protein, partial [Candidatus Bathyarchaeia archaeon]
MPKMPAMDAVVKILEDEGVEHIFGVPGGSINPFYGALSKSEKIKAYTFRHEEGAVHAADGYARASGKVGVCACIGGPAGTDMVTGFWAAYMDGVPLVAINGDIASHLRGEEGTTSINLVDVCEPITKKSYFVKEASQLPHVFREAFRIAREGRPGPVVIEMPVDIQRQEIVYEPDLDAPLEVPVPKPNMEKTERAIDMLLEAEKPLILLGGGVIRANASEELVKLAEYLAIPVIPTIMGKGGIRPDHPLYAGQVGTRLSIPPGNEVFLESDVVLAVGVRFADRHTGDKAVYRGNRKFIHVDIEPTQIGRIIPADLGIVSDAKLALQAMLEVAKKKTPKREPSPRVKEIPELLRKMARKADFDDVPIKPQRVFKEMNEFFDED